jgi:hypothetical protein
MMEPVPSELPSSSLLLLLLLLDSEALDAALLPVAVSDGVIVTTTSVVSPLGPMETLSDVIGCCVCCVVPVEGGRLPLL